MITMRQTGRTTEQFDVSPEVKHQLTILLATEKDVANKAEIYLPLIAKAYGAKYPALAAAIKDQLAGK